MNYVYGCTINNTRGVSDFGMVVWGTPHDRPKYRCALLPVPYTCQDYEYKTKVNVMGNECDFIIMGKHTIGFWENPTMFLQETLSLYHLYICKLEMLITVW